MRAGRLPHRITIQRLTETPDSLGALVKSWVAVATVWGSSDILSAREFFAASAVNAEQTVKFLIRYRTGIDSGMRVLFAGKTYDIQGVLPDERRTEITLMARLIDGRTI